MVIARWIVMARTGTYKKGTARRNEILQTAMQMLASDGYRNTSLSAIGRAMNVEPAHILYYFTSREELLKNVVQRWDEQSTDGRSWDDVDSRTVLDEYVATIRRNLAIPGIVHLYLTFAAEAVHPDHAAHQYFIDRFTGIHALMKRAIVAEQEQGMIDADADADAAARRLIALADGLQLQALVDSRVDAPGSLATAIDELRRSRPRA